MKFFKKRAVLVFLGLLLLSLFIWFAGPYFAFADFKPLEPVLARLIAILLLFMIWGLVALVKWLRARLAGVKLAQAVVENAAPAAGAASATSRESVQLRERFEEAVETLKKTQKDGRSLYDLPWYVIIGPPGSGKTTVLINSGLKFPLEQRFGKEALRGVGGTRNCDWWFTDEAVLLDTAGRYTTQDSDASADSAGWAEFLNLLTKYRRRRPLNGVIVTLSAADLMTQSGPEREANVAAVRRRLDELNRNLKVRLPIYVLVTKSDLIAGFSEYFDDLDAAGRSQVWGMTFAPERSLAGTAAEDFTREFDALIERLNQRLFGRIEEERDARRRTAAFAFPQQTAGLRNLIGAFVSEVFSATRFDGRLLLRGVYFTSGTQEGTPIDRLMSAIGRGFALAPDAVSGSTAGRGKAYFIERLLREVLFAEAGLAGVNRRRELQKAALQLGIYAALVLIAIIGVIGMTVSYSRNKAYLADVGASLDLLGTVAMPTPQQTLPQMLPGLEALRNVSETANAYRGQWALSRHWGLYQGEAVGDEAREAYQRELNGSLLPKIGDDFKTKLQSAAAQPDKLYQYLKAYLMLGEPEHLDKTQLAFLINLDWQDTYAAYPDILTALGLQLHNLIEDQKRLRPLPIDASLVAQSRNTVRQASIARLMYDQLKLIRADDTSHDLRLDVAAGIGAERVLLRKSGKKLSDPIPGLYTRAVFDQVSALGTLELVKQFSQDSWVMGDSAFDMQASARMAGDVMEVYADDYIKAWDGILADVQVVPLQNLAQAADVLGILGGPTSPLRGLLATVESNTNMAKPAEGGQPAASLAAAAAKAVMNPLNKLFGGNKPAAGQMTPAEKITAHFAAVDQLVQGPPGAAPIDRVIGQIAQIQQKMSGLGTGVGETNPLDALAKSGQGDALKSLQLQASTLPAPIGALVAQVGGRSESLAVGQARGELDQRYREQVVKQCQQIIGGRYPFTASSGIDVPLADFGRLFGVGGVFDQFYKENLAPLVDSTRSPWVWRAGGSGPAGASTGMLRQFEMVQQIRELYFGPGGQSPEQQFTLTPGDLDAGATRFTLEMDGQTLDYRHGPVRSMLLKWPGPSPGASAATFEDRSGAHPNLNFQGPWAWFRLLDAATIRAESDVRFDAAFQNSGHQATVIIEATSIRNPYQKSPVHQFRCGT
ncbi:MAG TPA: type VI secretion system membrane subunit TssM [Steroidobacteraceae bacterium]|nr:type VI secretion system membrane subunit TssM [Steroidobacteraceae bacterium]